MSALAAVDLQALHEQIRSARQQHKAGAGAVLDILLRGDVSPAALAEHGGVSVWAPSIAAQPDFAAWDKAAAKQARCVLLRAPEGRTIIAAAEDPWDDALMQRIARRIGTQPLPMAVGRAVLAGWLGESAAAGPPLRGGTGTSDRTSAMRADGPIVEFVDQSLRVAVRLAASDVHFECDRSGVTVKHRIDGVLVVFARLDGHEPAQEVISRIKVLAQLDITERRLPQDGRMRMALGNVAESAAESDGGELDLRVSIMPSVHGEDAVLRLLDKSRTRGRSDTVTLDSLGFQPREAGQIRELAYLPSGMVLVTGPTGSGKTTTVYAALSEINTGREKIVTIEDPVEYELAGVLQIPVNERKGLTFAKGLRSILRHDPDRILVGEIRDAETAEIAIQSALTGHLVFTTVHANSIGDVVGRFRHFGLDMFGFMSALNGVVVQRLLRCLCPACNVRRALSDAESHWLVRVGMPSEPHTTAAVGCDACHGTGYKGRFVVAEVHEVNDALRDQVTEGAPLSALKQHAREQGVEPLVQQALRAVGAGRTTIDEVRRVVGG
jgi:general secretion pathway protein E